MSTGVITWSQTGGLNASSDTAINFAEGQAPSTVNDSARNLMASVAKWRDDLTAVNISGGSGTVYTLASNQGIVSNIDGFTVQFTPSTSNTGAVTLSVDSQTARPLRFLTGVDLPAGVLISGSLYQATYRAASQEWLLHSFYTSVYSVPIAGIVDYAGTTAPNSSFALCYGQAVSRATYATLFALLSTTFGTGDGSTTFNLPDLRGRVVAGVDNMGGSAASRIGTVATDSTTIVGTTLGSVGGSATHALSNGEMPVHSHANSLNDPGHTHLVGFEPSGNAATAGVASSSNPQYVHIASTVSTNSASTGISITNANAGSGSAHAMLQPTIMLNKLIRLI